LSRNDFGSEFEISCFSYQDKFKADMPPNRFTFVTAAVLSGALQQAPATPAAASPAPAATTTKPASAARPTLGTTASKLAATNAAPAAGATTLPGHKLPVIADSRASAERVSECF